MPPGSFFGGVVMVSPDFGVTTTPPEPHVLQVSQQSWRWKRARRRSNRPGRSHSQLQLGAGQQVGAGQQTGAGLQQVVGQAGAQVGAQQSLRWNQLRRPQPVSQHVVGHAGAHLTSQHGVQQSLLRWNRPRSRSNRPGRSQQSLHAGAQAGAHAGAQQSDRPCP
ncbi:MAG: hypothetical protein U0793_07465 [Gemmataceae bacterium]